MSSNEHPIFLVETLTAIKPHYQKNLQSKEGSSSGKEANLVSSCAAISACSSS